MTFSGGKTKHEKESKISLTILIHKFNAPHEQDKIQTKAVK